MGMISCEGFCKSRQSKVEVQKLVSKVVSEARQKIQVKAMAELRLTSQ